MQLLYSTISASSGINVRGNISEDDLDDAALWIAQRLSARKTRDFFSPTGIHGELRGPLVAAVRDTAKFLFVDEFEVPHIWAHKRDHISHFDFEDVKARIELLTESELWRIYSLGLKYVSLAERRRAVLASYERLGVKDSYFDEEIFPNVDSAETVADASDWLTMKYKDKRKSDDEMKAFGDEGEDTVKKPKMPSRISAYEMAKKSMISKLAEVGLSHVVKECSLMTNLYTRHTGLSPMKSSRTLMLSPMSSLWMIQSSTPLRMQSSLLIQIQQKHKRLKHCWNVLA
jgi:transcription elongation factor SPT6